MISLNAINIDFTEELANSSTDLCNFKIDGIGYPESAIITHESKRIIATYSEIFTEKESPYYLQLMNIESKFGSPISDTVATFHYQEDVISPFVKSCELNNNQEVKIKFSETITTQSAQDTANYDLIFPASASNIEIDNIVLTENTAKLHFTDEIKATGKSYFIKMSNIKDLAGNIILPGKNLVKITLPITDLDAVLVGPNPASAKVEEVRFENLPTTGEADIFVYNFSGNLIKKLSNNLLSEDYNTMSWNLKNASDNSVASGVYFYIIKYSDEFKKGKIAVIR